MPALKGKRALTFVCIGLLILLLSYCLIVNVNVTLFMENNGYDSAHLISSVDFEPMNNSEVMFYYWPETKSVSAAVVRECWGFYELVDSGARVSAYGWDNGDWDTISYFDDNSGSYWLAIDVASEQPAMSGVKDSILLNSIETGNNINLYYGWGKCLCP